MPKHKTTDDFLTELDKSNLTVAAWARANQRDLCMTYSVIRGVAKGRRGEARQIMKAMGLPLPPMHQRLQAA